MISDDTKKLFPFINNVSDTAALLISEHIKSHFFQERSSIIFKGDKVGGVYLVEAGSLRVYNIDTKGRETTLYTVVPGESCLLALNCVFSELLYPAWVDVDTPLTKVSVIPSQVFKQLYNEENNVRDFAFEVLSSRVFDLMSTLEEFTSKSIEQRLASLLIRQANNDGKVVMNHQAIASHLGTAREVVTRTLKGFEKKGLLKTSRGFITITSIKELVSLDSS